MFPLHPTVPSAYPSAYASIDVPLSTLPPSPSSAPESTLKPNPSLFFKTAPPLDPAWLAHEATLPPPSNLVPPITDPLLRQQAYAQACRDRNASLLSGCDADLNHGIVIHDFVVDHGIDTTAFPLTNPPRPRRHCIKVRSYNQSSSPSGPSPLRLSGLGSLKSKPESENAEDEDGKDVVIYYHGGGLYVGDLDSEDLTCRRLVKAISCTVYSVDYRLMPQHSADDAVSDAMEAFRFITSTRKARRVVLMGSSSGGMLAAMVANRARVWKGVMEMRGWENKVHGVCLRGPVCCDATEGGVNLPDWGKQWHTSMDESFHTSLLSVAALGRGNRTTGKLPLEADGFEGLPRHWIQVCTNDIYYSDGVLYGEALKEAGVDIRLDLVKGWPHTFWLKAPELEGAIKAERDCMNGVKWLLTSEVEDVKAEKKED